MKKIFTIGILLCALVNVAQPVILNGNNVPAIGFNAGIQSVSGAGSPGAGGANLTWDFSSFSVNTMGVVAIVDPALTPYTTTFPQANFCSKITPTGSSTSIYSYEKISSTLWEAIATNYSGPGTGKDYTPNFESNLKFPFSYGETFTDYFQSTTSAQYPVDITYDAYGTLITPSATYTNVVRIKKYWGPGDYSYSWMSTNPLFIIMNYNSTSNSYVLVGSATADIQDINTNKLKVQLFPNPINSSSRFVISGNIKNFQNTMIIIYDALGKEVKQLKVDANEIIINRDGLENGIYFYKLINSNQIVATGKLIIN
jgi:hypothetical protein